MKKDIDVFEYAKEITQAIPQGVLITTKAGERVNSMTIGWGHLGVIWQRPVFIAFIREGRFTRPLLDEAGEFTINVPFGKAQKKITAYCGTKSGKNVDKVKELGLTLVESELVKAPAIKELPLTLECKVLYRQLQDKAAIPADILASMYPEDKDSTNCGCNRDAHVAYYGEIVKSYIIED
ncbi:MAG: flavin reductase family protein [Desulfovibrionaceae bacterium]|nr:flavin reductase family protein [Desulfovibrionaceae bacterium]